MPISKHNRSRYPKNWKEIRAHILERARGRCECRGECGDHEGMCPEADGQPAVHFKGKCHLAPAHQNHVPEDCRDENLKAYCQRCHLSYDRIHHVQNRSETMAKKRQNQGWDDGGWED